MNILRKDLPLSSLILADALIAAGDELYATFICSHLPSELTERQRDALLDYAIASNALHLALKSTEPPDVTSSQRPTGA